MSDEKPVQNLISKLQPLGDKAEMYYWDPPENEEERVEASTATRDFIEAYKNVPEKLEADPTLINENLGAKLMDLCIRFGYLDNDLGEVFMAAGRILGWFDKNHPEAIDPAMSYLKFKIKSGWEWKQRKDCEAWLERNDALEILYWAVLANPKWANAEWTRIACQAAVLPFRMDGFMIDNILYDMKKLMPLPTEYFAGFYSSNARKTLGEIVALSPDLAHDAGKFVKGAKKWAESNCDEKLRPVIATAAEQAECAIFNAIGKSFSPEEAPRTVCADSFRVILAL
jgi:hypothetical protein